MSLVKVRWLLFAIIVIVIAIIYTDGLDSYTHYHMDEGFWIETSKWTFRKFVIERDFSANQWLSWQLRSFGRTNPNAGKLLIGGVLFMNGYSEFRGLPAWDMSQSYQWNIEHGNAAPPNELSAARGLIVLMTAFTTGLIFMGIVLEIPGWRGVVGGILAAVVFSTHRLVYELGRQVMLDMPALFFGVASIISVWQSIKSDPKVQRWVWGVFAGIFSGLAVSTKLNAGIASFSVLIVGLLAAFSKRTKGSLFLLVMVLFLPPLIFLVLNPQLWPDIRAGVQTMLDFGKSIAARRELFPDAALWTVADRLRAFYVRIFEKPLEFLLFVAGFVILLKNWRTTWPVLVYGLLGIFGVLGWTPLNWNRYYLPSTPFYALVIGYLFAMRPLLGFEKDSSR